PTSPVTHAPEGSGTPWSGDGGEEGAVGSVLHPPPSVSSAGASPPSSSTSGSPAGSPSGVTPGTSPESMAPSLNGMCGEIAGKAKNHRSAAAPTSSPIAMMNFET